MKMDNAPESRPPGRAPLTSYEKIDICRGLFAFLVVAAHAIDITWVIRPEAPRAMPGWLHDLWLHVGAAGVYWVIGFFVISGYCIQLSVERQTKEGRFPLRNYLIARVSRILPLYYAALASALFFEWLMAANRPDCWPNGLNLGTLGAQVLVLQNLSQTFGSFAPSWSITNEMCYYLFYGVVVASALRWGVRPTMLGMTVCLALAIILEWAYFVQFRDNAVARNAGLLFGLGTLWFQGALVAEYREAIRASRAARFISGLWPLVLLMAMGLWYARAIHLQILYLILGAAFTMMLARFAAVDPPGARMPDRGARSVLIRSLGLASYPTYLFHGPLLMWLASLLLRAGWTDHDWRLTWIALSFAGIASGLILGYVAERPLMTWRAGLLRQLKDERPTREATAGAAPILDVSR